jgi:hypothetical protein
VVYGACKSKPLSALHSENQFFYNTGASLFLRQFFLRDKFRFNVMWHRRFLAALFFCWKLAESYVTLMRSVTRMDWLRWWYDHAADVVPPPPQTTSSFVIKTSQRRKSASPSAIQVKNPRKRIRVDEKLDVIRRLEKGERTVDTWLNVIFAHISIGTIRDSVVRVTESAKFVFQECHLHIGMNHTRHYGCQSLIFLSH